MKITIDTHTLVWYNGQLPHLLSDGCFLVGDDFIRDYKTFLSGRREDNFTSILIQLISKADVSNLVKLSLSFPGECAVIWMYQNIDGFHKQIEDYIV